MGLYKRPNKDGSATWCVQYFAGGRRYREAVGPSKREAQLVLGKRQAAIREGKFFDVVRETPLAFGVLCDRYLKEYAALQKKPRSYLRNVSSTKVLVAFFGKDTPIRQVSPEKVHQFMQSRREAGKSPATINAEMTHLSHLFTWATKLKLTTSHPCRGIGHLKTHPKERYLTHAEMRTLLDATDRDLHDMIVLALGTGMRASEMRESTLTSGVGSRSYPIPRTVIDGLFLCLRR